MPLGTEVNLGPVHTVLDGNSDPFRETGTAFPLFSAHVYCGHGRPSQLLLSSCHYFAAGTGAKYCGKRACMSARSHVSKTTCPYFTKSSADITSGRGSGLQ